MFNDGTIAEQTSADINSAFFATLDNFPLASVTSVIAIILVVMFFVSGADANTYVLSMMTSGGSLVPRRAVLILWGVLTGITAIVLMLAGGLNALQNTVIVTSAPFLVIIAGLAISFWKELQADKRTTERELGGAATPAEGAHSPSAQGGSAQVSAAAGSVER
jgi:choline-glycine betaine transporter